MDYQTLQPTGFQRLTALFVLAASTLVIAAGHAPNRYAWLAKDPNNTYDNATLAGIREIANLTGTVVDPFYAAFDPVTQLSQCQQAIGSGLYSGIFVESADAIAIEPCVAAAHAKHIPVVATDLPIGPDPTTVQPQVPGEVGASFLPASRWGTGLTNILPQACQGLATCHVFYLAGDVSLELDMLGIQAIQTAAAANPAVVLTVVDQAFYDTPTAKQVAMTQLQAHPEINMVVAAGDQMALVVEQAATTLGQTVRILGAGAGETAIEAVKAGRWFATFNALPKTEGELGAGLMALYLLDNKIKPMGLDPITVTGLPDWWTKTTLAEHPTFAPQWPGPM